MSNNRLARTSVGAALVIGGVGFHEQFMPKEASRNVE